ncbi:jg27112 [Pararge aegeria aegeria]|uniref:Jg27112 protein n=1 Tax=Pararge aegeria aegeria TaxID=348720 RepID=A0A8S4QNF6_9NEOP|nr:jg27112 [Pararge aegeria aegeria]
MLGGRNEHVCITCPDELCYKSYTSACQETQLPGMHPTPQRYISETWIENASCLLIEYEHEEATVHDD